MLSPGCRRRVRRRGYGNSVGATFIDSQAPYPMSPEVTAANIGTKTQGLSHSGWAMPILVPLSSIVRRSSSCLVNSAGGLTGRYADFTRFFTSSSLLNSISILLLSQRFPVILVVFGGFDPSLCLASLSRSSRRARVRSPSIDFGDRPITWLISMTGISSTYLSMRTCL